MRRIIVEATARKWPRLRQAVRFCSAMRNQASWVSAVALSVWPARSCRMWLRARRLSSS
jgi:hypothetical protein